MNTVYLPIFQDLYIIVAAFMVKKSNFGINTLTKHASIQKNAIFASFGQLFVTYYMQYFET